MTAVPELVLKPKLSWRLLARHPAHFIACGGGVGLIPMAPGTFGTLLAFPLFWAVSPWLEPIELLLLIAAMFLVGVWACERTGRALGVADHPGMVWDEVVAFMLVLFFVPSSAYWQASAFLLFRLFDIFKPPPIRYYERTFKTGFGVMIDDIVAAFYALIVLAAWKAVWG